MPVFKRSISELNTKIHNFTSQKKVTNWYSYASPQRSGPKPLQTNKSSCSGSVYYAVRVPVAAFPVQLEPQPCVFSCVHACAFLEALHKSRLKSAFFVLFWNLAINKSTKKKVKLGIGSVTSSGGRKAPEINISVQELEWVYQLLFWQG